MSRHWEITNFICYGLLLIFLHKQSCTGPISQKVCPTICRHKLAQFSWRDGSVPWVNEGIPNNSLVIVLGMLRQTFGYMLYLSFLHSVLELLLGKKYSFTCCYTFLFHDEVHESDFPLCLSLNVSLLKKIWLSLFGNALTYKTRFV